ncbi:hypothetical protein [Limnoglobus roseus]|uniref:hypothetical protein n=1 Tax=Limnoglobus roseus TaxID=2598579 RepID=UPI00143DB66C|nr:hypothetical protein [Limnoglobus roseus]
MHENALRIRRAAIAPYPPFVAEIFLHLATCRDAAGDRKGAEEMFVAGLDAVRRRYGENHVKTLQIYYMFAHFHT